MPVRSWPTGDSGRVPTIPWLRRSASAERSASEAVVVLVLRGPLDLGLFFPGRLE